MHFMYIESFIQAKFRLNITELTKEKLVLLKGIVPTHTTKNTHPHVIPV